MTDYTDNIQFNRTYMLKIGAMSPTEPGFFVDSLRVVFSFDKSLEKTPNSGSVEVYNLSRQSRRNIERRAVNILKESKDGGNYIPSLQFEAGYRDKNKLVFQGTITNITTRKHGPDVVTIIEVGDGFSSYQDAKINQSFGPGVTADQVSAAIIQSMGLKVGEVVGFNALDQYLKGASFSGAARDALTKLLKKQNLEWSIQDNAIQVLPPNTPTSKPPIELNRATGLVGAPYRTWFLDDSAFKKKSTTDIQQGLYGTALLNADIAPGQLLVIEPRMGPNFTGPPDEEGYGLVRVIKCRHYGDTHGNPWYTDFVAE